MPKIRIDGYENPGLRGDCGNRGLRTEVYTQEERPVRDDCFDMYRTDERGIQKKYAPAVKKRIRREQNGPQLWYIAGIISALGVFCLFTDTLAIDMGVAYLKYSPLDLLLSADEIDGKIPPCTLYLSLMPLVFAISFGLFAYFKEDVFEKGSLALIAVAILVIIADIFLAMQISDYGGHIRLFTVGIAVPIEIVCSVALIIVTVCKMVLDRKYSAGPTASRW